MELTGLFIDEVIPDGLVYDHFIGTNWTNNGTMFYYAGSLAVGEDVEEVAVVDIPLPVSHEVPEEPQLLLEKPPVAHVVLESLYHCFSCCLSSGYISNIRANA